jgi:hypothetical protein
VGGAPRPQNREFQSEAAAWEEAARNDKMKKEKASDLLSMVRCEGQATVWYRSSGGEVRIGLA